MSKNHYLISAVDRVVETPDVWTRRLSKSRFGARIPHLERSSDGGDRWVVDGRALALNTLVDVGALMPDRADTASTWEAIPTAAYDSTARLKIMDEDEIDCAILYPTVGGFSGEIFGAINDADLELACVQAYNDWLIEDWTSTSDRFIAQCMVPLWPIEATVKEIERAVGTGPRGVIFPAVPMHLRTLPHINDPANDPVWAMCADLGVPLCFHAGSALRLQFPTAPSAAPQLAAAFRAAIRPASAVFELTNMLFSRILLRFPKLKVVFAESTVGWGTFLLEYADHQYEQDHCDYELKPSEMFHRQCFLTSWYDPLKIHARHIGADRILWAANFPAANSSWPDTRAFLDQCLAAMSDDEREQIVYGNAAKLYRVTLDETVGARTN